MKRLLFSGLLLICTPIYAAGNWIDPSAGQSTVSDASLEPLINLTALSAEPANSKLSIKSIHVVGDTVEIIGLSVATGVFISWNISVESLKIAGLVVGGTVILTAVSGGFLVMAGSEALAFIPDAISQSHMHHRKLSP
jgi:hypothetical protein